MRKKKWKRLYLSAFCAASCCLGASFSAQAQQQQASGAAGANVWPDIRELQYKIQEYRDEASVFQFHDYSQEELHALFGSLPLCVESGSFILNDLHHFLTPRQMQDLPTVRLGDGYMIVRPAFSSLKRQIAEMIAGYEGDWSVYLKDLTSGQTMELNEHTMESASLIKLFIAGAIYEQFDLGHLAEDETLLSALEAMITVSDNESSNVLVRAICDESGDFQTGLAKVNDFIARKGFTNTQQVNGIADPSLWVADGRVNMTSAADCGRLLEMVYNRTLVSHFNCFRFEVLLNRQEVNYKIPAGLPEGVHISHKTGEVDDTESDAAIIYTPYGDYILCILSTDLYDTGSAVDQIHSITRLTYDYFTGHVVRLDAEDTPVDYLPGEPYVLLPWAEETVQ